MISKYQIFTDAWIRDCFGVKIGLNRRERTFRFLEESLELVQATGELDTEDVLRTVHYVAERAPGIIAQEVGGVMVTLAAFCNVFGIDLDEAASTELARCIMNTARIRAKHSEKPEGIRS